MALSKPSTTGIKDLLQCGICLTTIKEPKALPCLHSYCLKCLAKWAEDTNNDTVRCPLCNQDFPLPEEGVQGFVTNFIIDTLKARQELVERLQTKDTHTACSCCGEEDSRANSYCTDCGGFICEGCSSQHDVIMCLKSHSTIPFEDLRAGKVDINSVIRLRHDYCDVHEDEKAEFHCKTCDALVCDGCTTENHLEHEFVGLQVVTEEHRSELKQLMTDCGIVSEAVAESLEDVELVQENLRKSVEKAKSDLRRATEKIKARVLADLQRKEDHMMAKIMTAANENNKEIEAHRESLLMNQTRFQTALRMADATHAGSDHNFALFFRTLRNSMIRLISDTVIEEIDEDLGLIRFTASKSMSTLPKSLGSVSIGGADETTSPVTSQVCDERNFFPWE